MTYNVSFDICAAVITALCVVSMLLHKDLKRFEKRCSWASSHFTS